MKKLMALVAMMLVFAMMLTSCGSGSQDTPADNTPDEKEPDTVTAKVLRVGGIGPLTGDYANYGTSVRNGAQLAVDEINAAGGINGMEVVLDFQDSQGDPDSAVAAYGKLMDSGMNLSLATVFSGECASVTQVANGDDILMLSPSASNDACIASNDYAFRVCFTDSSQGKFTADYIADHNMATDVAVFYQSDYDYSVGLYESFEAEAKVKGINITCVQTFDGNTDTDFSTQIAAIKDAGVKLVFIPIYAAEASTFLSQAKGKLDDDVMYFGCDGLDGILTKVEDNPSLADNVLELTPYAADDPDPVVQTFVKAYESEFGSTPDQFAADGYDAIYIFKAAIEKGGFSDPADCTGSALVPMMLSLEYTGVTGTMTWEANGNTNKNAKAMIIMDGKASIYLG